MTTHFSNHYLALAAGCKISELEASFLLWQFEETQKALEYVSARKRAAYLQNNKDSLYFWRDVENIILVSIEEGIDKTADLISLIAYVDAFYPKEKWITPILEGVQAQDFRTQLVAAVEDYRSDGKSHV